MYIIEDECEPSPQLLAHMGLGAASLRSAFLTGLTTSNGPGINSRPLRLYFSGTTRAGYNPAGATRLLVEIRGLAPDREVDLLSEDGTNRWRLRQNLRKCSEWLPFFDLANSRLSQLKCCAVLLTFNRLSCSALLLCVCVWVQRSSLNLC